MQEQHIAEGDPVLFSGLFVQYISQSRMEPIVRTGTLAMLPKELVMTTLKAPGRVYLTEAHVFGGNSGSPMFVNVGGLRNGALFSSTIYKLLGVVAGELFENQQLELQVATTYQGKVEANSGISIIVPADEVVNLLNSSKLQAARDAIVRSKGRY